MKQHAKLSEEERQAIIGKMKRLYIWSASCFACGLALPVLLVTRALELLGITPPHLIGSTMLANVAVLLSVTWIFCGCACVSEVGSLGSRMKRRGSKRGLQ